MDGDVESKQAAANALTALFPKSPARGDVAAFEVKDAAESDSIRVPHRTPSFYRNRFTLLSEGANPPRGILHQGQKSAKRRPDRQTLYTMQGIIDD